MLKIKVFNQKVVILIYAYLCVAMSLTNYAACIAEEESPFANRTIILENGGKLVPYPGSPSDEVKEKKALEVIFTDPTVYPNFLQGVLWTEEILTSAHARAIRYAEDLHSKGYKKLRLENALICINWFLQVDNKLVGRGGLYWEPEAGSIPEVFLGIAAPYQRKGWGTKAFTAMIEWFKTHILPMEFQPLRWLAKADNEMSKALAGKLGFMPVLTAEGKQEITYQNDIEYLVFERKFTP